MYIFKIVPTNSGWFQQHKSISVFTKPYGQRILSQTMEDNTMNKIAGVIIMYFMYNDGKTANDTDEDMGTYNFYSAKDNPIRHFVFDILPYWLWGNTENDKTPLSNRILGKWWQL